MSEQNQFKPPKDVYSFDEVLSTLISEPNKLAQHLQVSRRFQKIDETFDNYWDEKILMFNELPDVSLEYKLTQLMCGLKESLFLKTVNLFIVSMPKSESELYNRIKLIEIADVLANQFEPSRTVPIVTTSSFQVLDLTQKAGTSTVETQTTRGSKRSWHKSFRGTENHLCPNCLRVGHYLTECPDLPDSEELEREIESDTTVNLDDDPPVPDPPKSE
jgi:hypothetical protein